MTDDEVAVPIEELGAYLAGQTLVRCAPARAGRVQRILSESEVPSPFYRVEADPQVADGVVVLTRVDAVADWSP